MVARTGCNPRGSNTHHNQIRAGITDHDQGQHRAEKRWQRRRAAESFDRVMRFRSSGHSIARRAPIP